MAGRSYETTGERAARTLSLAPRGVLGLALGVGAALTGLAFWNRGQMEEVEQANPPMGGFIEVTGVRLHHLARGQGQAVVFLHGLGGMVQDWHLSMLDAAAAKWRAIAFDRPGYGHSDRPGWSSWTPEKQAEILRRAARRMGADKPVVVAHDFATLVALAWALDYPEDLGGLVLIGGYYYPERRMELPLLSLPNMGGLGAIARNTVSPMLGKSLMPKVMERIFAPNPVPDDYAALYPTDMMLRPGQMKAQAEDMAHLRPAARRLSPRYGEIRVPTVIMAGDSDQVVDPVAHAVRLHQQIRHSSLRVVPEAGHMLHHVAPAEVMEAIALAAHEAELQRLALGPGAVRQAQAVRAEAATTHIPPVSPEDQAPAAMI